MCLVEVIHNNYTTQYFHEKQANTKIVISVQSDDTHRHQMGNGDVIHGCTCPCGYGRRHRNLFKSPEAYICGNLR
jgi:hypothetical protein